MPTIDWKDLTLKVKIATSEFFFHEIWCHFPMYLVHQNYQMANTCIQNDFRLYLFSFLEFLIELWLKIMYHMSYQGILKKLLNHLDWNNTVHGDLKCVHTNHVTSSPPQAWFSPLTWHPPGISGNTSVIMYKISGFLQKYQLEGWNFAVW